MTKNRTKTPAVNGQAPTATAAPNGKTAPTPKNTRPRRASGAATNTPVRNGTVEKDRQKAGLAAGDIALLDAPDCAYAWVSATWKNGEWLHLLQNKQSRHTQYVNIDETRAILNGAQGKVPQKATRPAAPDPAKVTAELQQLGLIPEMQIQPVMTTVDLADLPPNEELISDAPTTAFVQSVSRFGVMQPIILTEGPSGYKVRAGRRRVKAARATGTIQAVPAIIYPAGWVSGAVITAIENELRSQNIVSDLLAIEELLASGASETQICDAIGMSPKTFAARVRLKGLVKSLYAALLAGQIPSTVAEQALRLSPDRQLILCDALNKNGTVTLVDVKNALATAAAAAVSVLPAQIFGPPDAAAPAPSAAPGAIDWHRQAETLLSQVFLLVPPDCTPILHALGEVVQMLRADAILDTTPVVA